MIQKKSFPNTIGSIVPGAKPMRGRLAGRKSGKMNKTETRFSEVLESRLLSGEIVYWEFEPISLVVGRSPEGKSTRWTADFVWQEADGRLFFCDTKGTRPIDEEAQKVKIKCAAEKFPFFFFCIEREQKAGGFERELF